jgi:FlaA1/EpsC-like NDP-sugar epimerase
MAKFSQDLVPDIEKVAQEIDPNQYTYPFQLTKTMHRDPYDELLPSKPSNSQKGKIVIITGAYGGIGSVFTPFNCPKPSRI